MQRSVGNEVDKQTLLSVFLSFVCFFFLIFVWFQINQQKLLGEINFFPLNRLIAKPRREVNDPVRYFKIRANEVAIDCIS